MAQVQSWDVIDLGCSVWGKGSERKWGQVEVYQ